ncbi:MAG: hypothetical protein KH020_10290 [Clostridiales bacterium]|nr:hypothetical protein [Clostridiales bacterium]MBS6560153.1 hypothetical protein [Clostridiales bacterium]
MKDRILDNWAMKVLSVILAIIIWLLVTNIDNPYTTKTFTDISVNVINEDALLKKNKTWDIIEGDKVTVTLKAKRSVIDKLTRADIQATADLSKLSITNAVPINVTVSHYEEEIKEKNLGSVDTLKVKLENMKTKQFAVTVETIGDVGAGYAIGTKIPTPNIVEVTGPESLIKRINQVRATISVDGIVSDETFSVEPSYYNYDGDKLDSSRLSCNVERLEVSINLLKTKKVDLSVETVGEVAKGYQLESVLLEPKSVTIAGTEEKLKDLDTILVDGLSVEGLTEDTEENIDITDYLPDGIKLAQESPDVRVKIQIVPLDMNSIKIPVNRISVQNQSQSMTLTYEEDEITVKVRGEQKDIKDLDISDLTPSIDLSGLEVGKHKVKVKLKTLENAYYEDIPEITIQLEEKVVEGQETQ